MSCCACPPGCIASPTGARYKFLFFAEIFVMMPHYETLLTALEDRLLTVTLNRPEQLNAFTVTMADELVDVFQRASEADEVGAVIVTGAGRAFCAGMDLSVPGNVFGLDETQNPTLSDLRLPSPPEAIERGVRDTGGRVTLAIFACKKPVIGAINGAAVGIGATMTLAMDVRLVSDKARLGFVFGKIGVVPEACSSWFLPRLVGLSQALEWVYTGEILSADAVAAAGLTKPVLAPDDLLPEARRLATRFIQHRSPVAIAFARQMLYRNSAEPHPRRAHEIDSLAMFDTSRVDGKEGVASFLEKRDPQYASQASAMPESYEAWIRWHDRPVH